MTADILTGLSMMVNMLKDIKEMGEKAQYAEVMKGISEMSAKLSEMTMSVSVLQSENTSLKEEIRKLKDFESRGLHIKDGAMYDRDNNGPYCPNCYENHRILNLMSPPLPNTSPKCSQCRYNMPEVL